MMPGTVVQVQHWRPLNALLVQPALCMFLLLMLCGCGGRVTAARSVPACLKKPDLDRISLFI
jgi:hypothetical protein